MDMDIRKNDNQNFLIVILIIIIAFLLMQKCSDYSKAKENKNLVSSLTDNVKIWKDKDSASHAKIEVIETYNIKSFKYLQIKDEQINELQKLVSQYKNKIKDNGSITTFKDNIVVKNKFITKIDTVIVYKDNYLTKQINYKSDFDMKGWVIGNIVANKDSTTLNLKIKNEYIVIFGEEPQGWFKPKKPYAEVINKNPYSQIAQLRSYQVKNKPPSRIGLGAIAGYGITSTLTPSFFLGLGLQYSLIRF